MPWHEDLTEEIEEIFRRLSAVAAERATRLHHTWVYSRILAAARLRNKRNYERKRRDPAFMAKQRENSKAKYWRAKRDPKTHREYLDAYNAWYAKAKEAKYLARPIRFEKCRGCGKPILQPNSRKGPPQVWCSEVKRATCATLGHRRTPLTRNPPGGGRQ